MQPHSVYQYINDPAMRNEGVAFVHDGRDDGRLEPVIDRVFEFDDYRSAFEYQVAAVARRGKLVIRT